MMKLKTDRNNLHVKYIRYVKHKGTQELQIQVQ